MNWRLNEDSDSSGDRRAAASRFQVLGPYTASSRSLYIVKTWTELPVEESVRMTEDRDKWGNYVHMVWPTVGWRTAKERNRIQQRRAGQ